MDSKTEPLDVYREIASLLHGCVRGSKAPMVQTETPIELDVPAIGATLEDVIHACEALKKIEPPIALAIANATRKPICDKLFQIEKRIGELRAKIEKLP